MNFKLYTNIINHQIEKCQEMLTAKRAEYANDESPVKNFTRSKQLLDCNTTVHALATKMDKHTISIYDMIKAHENGKRFLQSQWDEKITDHINYLLLLQVVLEEQREQEETKLPEKENEITQDARWR